MNFSQRSENALFLSECGKQRKKVALLEPLGPFLRRRCREVEALRSRFEGVSKVHLGCPNFLEGSEKKKVAKAIGSPRCSATLTIRAERAFV